jgi:hypothetical protein
LLHLLRGSREKKEDILEEFDVTEENKKNKSKRELKLKVDNFVKFRNVYI